MIFEPYHLYLLLGVVLIVVEILLLQLLVGWVLLLGLASIFTSVIINLYQLSYLQSNFVLLLIFAILVAICIKPLRKWQQKNRKMADSSDIIGQTCVVVKVCTKSEVGEVKFSGTKWQATLHIDDNFEVAKVGQTVTIDSAQGIKLIVRS